MRARTIATAMILAAAAFAEAQSFTADYVQGTVAVLENGSWYDVSIGDTVMAEGSIRLGKASFAELSDGAMSVKLSSPGIYKLADLVTDSVTNRAAGIGTLMARRLDALSTFAADAHGTDSRPASTAGGVRAEQAQVGPETVWAGGDSSDQMVKEGVKLLKEGNFEAAFYRFKDAYDIADPSYAPVARFYMGFTASLRNDTRDAIRDLTAYPPDSSKGYYSDQVLTLAQLYDETFAYRNALDLLATYLDGSKLTASDRQTAYLLQGLAYRGLQDISNAKVALQRSRDLISGSETSMAAERVLAGLSQ